MASENVNLVPSWNMGFGRRLPISQNRPECGWNAPALIPAHTPIRACVWQRDLHGGELFLEENKLNSLFAFGLYEVLDAKWPCDHIHHQ